MSSRRWRAGQAEGEGDDTTEADQADAGPPQEPVGEAPEEDRDQVEGVSALYDVGGVLTPKGHFVLEPSLEFSHASANRFTFRGVELQEVLLLAVIEAQDADRDFVSANLTGRLGVTERGGSRYRWSSRNTLPGDATSKNKAQLRNSESLKMTDRDQRAEESARQASQMIQLFADFLPPGTPTPGTALAGLASRLAGWQ